MSPRTAIGVCVLVAAIAWCPGGCTADDVKAGPAAAPPMPPPAVNAVAIKPGPKKAVTVVRLSYDDAGWLAGRNYHGFEVLTREMLKRADVALEVDETGAPPAALAGADIVYLAGSGGSQMPHLPYQRNDREALKAYLTNGGFLWAEATAGSKDFAAKFLTFAAGMGWKVEPLARDHAILTGRFQSASGYDVSQAVQFRRALRTERTGKPWADLQGVYQDGRLVGVFSPFDVVFSSTGYEAYGLRGYATEDAKAVAANIFLYVTDRPAKDPPP